MKLIRQKLTMVRVFQIYLIWISSFFLLFISIGRTFGTDIENYLIYFNSWYTDEAYYSLEPIYLILAELLQNIGLRPTLVIDLTAVVSLALIALFASRQRFPIATLVILLGWLLFQQVWGTIRMGLGVCILLFANEIYIRNGRIPYWTFFASIFHWSLLANPLTLFIRSRTFFAVFIALSTYVFIVIIGSIRNLFFDFVPPEIEAIANYAALQNGVILRMPSPVPLVIHLGLVYALAKVCTKEELSRYLGPLTLLYCATCLFFDFEQASGRVSNILISIKLLALIKVYDCADRIISHGWLVRFIIISYSVLVAVQYYLNNVDYF